jgi:arylsulfatase A-like enzyme
MKTILLIAAFTVLLASQVAAAERPHILWLTSEDHGPQMGCYGDSLARTPNVDALAAKGMTFAKVWSIAPVCAPARTAIITGLYPSSSGGLHMRSMVSLPAEFKLYPQYLREAGYYCTNNSKTDYNVRVDAQLWSASSGKAHWKNRRPDQPFFAIFNSTKSHESQIRTRPHLSITDPQKVHLPAYHPDAPEVRQDWAQYYDKVSEADADAGRRLRELEDAGLADDTIVFYFADHGSGMPRSKRWPCNSGLHVPMVVHFPNKWKHLAPKEYSEGAVSQRMISFVDLAPTILSLVGIEPPAWMQGHAFAGPYQSEPQPFLFGERGRMDERMDLVRSVTDGRFVYLRNYFTHVSQAQRVAYQFETPTTRIWFNRFQADKTNEAQSIFWRVPKDTEELYDLQADPDEVQNLATSPEHFEVLTKLRTAQQNHLREIRDVCFLPEPELHSRAEGSSPYEIARDPKVYPLERIISAADIASRRDSESDRELGTLLRDNDSAVRYWAAMGMLQRGLILTTEREAALNTALADQSSSVRIVAAQVLGQHGNQESRRSALAALKQLGSPQRNGVLVAMEALAAVESLGEDASSLNDTIAKFERTGPAPDERYSNYVPRLIENIVGDATESSGAIQPKPKKRKAN